MACLLKIPQVSFEKFIVVSIAWPQKWEDVDNKTPHAHEPEIISN